MTSEELPRLFLEKLADLKLDRRGTRILVACSGGSDSVALLRLSVGAAQQLGLAVAAGHVNHQLRGRDSERDEAFVGVLCCRLGIRSFQTRVDVRGSPITRRVGLEAAARVLRYGAFAVMARRMRAHAVLTAHTLEDQSETVLLNLLRGSGTKGLCGIWEACHFPGAKVPVLRPLLGVRRSVLKSYLKAIGQPYREDQSNRSVKFLRNWVRHRVLPLLRRRSPALDNHLFHLSAILQAEEALLGEFETDLDFNEFLRYPIAVQRRLLHRVWPVQTRFNAIESLRRRLTRRQSTHQISWDQRPSPMPGGNGWLAAFSRPLRIPGRNENLPGQWCLKGRVIPGRPPQLNKGPWVAFLDWEKVLGRTCRWRSWRTGDRFQPLRMQGTKKLSDLFCDEKIPTPARESIPILEVDGRVAWVVGLRMGDAFKVGPDTSQTLVLEAVKKHEKS